MNSLKKEDIENLSYKDITNLILINEKRGMNTLDLFTYIVNVLELPKSILDSKIGPYYTSLTTDKRFVLIDGLWDLRSRHTSDKVIVKVDDEDDDIEPELDDEPLEEKDVDEEPFDGDNDVEDDFGDDSSELDDLVVIDEDEMELENN